MNEWWKHNRDENYGDEDEKVGKNETFLRNKNNNNNEERRMESGMVWHARYY
jgi:hypothetical protein